MRLVKNSEVYWEFIRKLRNDPLVKVGFIEQKIISENDQIQYMMVHGNKYYICLIDDVPVGYIGEVDMDIRLAVHPEHQRKGVARFMLDEFMEIEPRAVAKALLNNKPSERLFLSSGFIEVCRNERFRFFIKKT